MTLNKLPCNEKGLGIVHKDKNMVEERRFGIFRISKSLIWQNPGMVAEHLFSKMVITRCECRLGPQMVYFEYEAISDLFDPVPEGEFILLYDVEICKDGGNITVTVRKVCRTLHQPGSGR